MVCGRYTAWRASFLQPKSTNSGEVNKMETLVQKLEKMASVEAWRITANDRETIGQALELARADEHRIEREKRELENEQNALQQARAQMSSISEMVAALNCDYDRLQELRDERENLTFDVSIADQDSAERELAKIELSKWEAENLEELTELESAAGNCESDDEARERIQDDPLDIQVRSGWQSLGETLEPEEFTILLCTGGPAVRIVGELDQYNQPCRAWIEYQDWFTPWRELVDDVSHSDLLMYCQQFYFGE